MCGGSREEDGAPCDGDPCSSDRSDYGTDGCELRGSVASVPYWAIAVIVVVVLATIAAIVIHVRRPPEANGPVLLGAGDIASCHNEKDEATAELLGKIPGTVFTMGDNAYPSGTSHQFEDCYGPTWGRYKDRTRPAVGNHEYQTNNASGYFDYFGSAAGPPSKGYYSYDLGDWHVVVLNGMCEKVGGCGSNSPMVGWLDKDLAANSGKKCTLAYFHHPLFSSGFHGNQTKMAATWEA